MKLRMITKLFFLLVFITSAQAGITCLNDYEDSSHRAIQNSTTIFKCFTDQEKGSYTFSIGDDIIKQGNITDPHSITAMHKVNDTNFNMTLIINQERKIIPVEIIPKNHENEVKKAKEDALWYLHQQINRYKKGDTSYGYWINDYLKRWSVAYTGMVISAMQLAGYEAGSNHPYGKDIEYGLNHILSKCRYQMIGEQYSGEPDNNNNSIGLKCSNFRQHTNYEVSISLLALSLSDPDKRNSVMQPFVYNRTNKEIAQDIVDWLSWAQNENIASRGGYGAWYYTPNNANGDMSVSQWPSFAIAAAKRNLNITAPDKISQDLYSWIKDSQMDSGAFTYRGREKTPIDNIAMTASGLIQTAHAGYNKNSEIVKKGIDYIIGNWYINQTRDRNKHLGNYYAMQGVDKVCSIFNLSIENTNCTQKYQEYLLTEQTDSGYWQDTSYLKIHVGPQLATSWAIIILENPELFSTIYNDFS